MMNYCPNCGSKLCYKKKNFCSQCGTKLDDNAFKGITINSNNLLKTYVGITLLGAMMRPFISCGTCHMNHNNFSDFNINNE